MEVHLADKMEDNLVQQSVLQSSSKAEDNKWFLAFELSEDDPLFEKKKKLLEDKGFDPQGHAFLETSGPNWSNKTIATLVQRARIICSDEVELYFGGVDVNSSKEISNPRIELEALDLILSIIDKTLCSGNQMITSILKDLRNACVDVIRALGDKIKLETIVTDSIGIKERCQLQWAVANGVQTKLDVACVQRAGRGAIATEDLKVGDIALEIPVSVIISEECLKDSDMFPILEEINGISSETMLLLWSMKEKHNYGSKFKFYFDALPEVFNTGLSFGVQAIMTLDGTLLLEEIVQAKEHLRAQYDELFPALSNDYPHIFPADLYTWEQFLWACELWYSNGMKVMFTDGKLQTCLVPIAGFLNHSLCPHILHYGKVDSATNSLRFPLSRPCNVGEQCYLSYGKFSSSHFVTFYGFFPEENNPYDVIPLDLESTTTECLEDSYPLTNWSDNMVRGTWNSKNLGIFYYGLPPPLLDHYRRARSPMPKTNSCTQENLETELEVLEDLRSTFESMLVTLDDQPEPDNCSLWDVNLGTKIKDLHRRIASSIVASCHEGAKLVEYELENLKA